MTCNEELATAVRAHIAAFKDEIEEHGFPFNFALRESFAWLERAAATPVEPDGPRTITEIAHALAVVKRLEAAIVLPDIDSPESVARARCITAAVERLVVPAPERAIRADERRVAEERIVELGNTLKRVYDETFCECVIGETPETSRDCNVHRILKAALAWCRECGHFVAVDGHAAACALSKPAQEAQDG